MKVIEQVYREILYQAIEKNRIDLTQLELSKTLGIGLSVVNYALRPIKAMGAIAVAQRGFRTTDIKKILYYWASLRDIRKDVVYSTRANVSVSEIEKLMPPDAVFAAYSAYKFRYNDVPADYSEVYVYSSTDEARKRFPPSKNPPNLFVLKPDKNLKRYGSVTIAGQTFVDLWNLKEWYAKDFLKALEARMGV